MSAWAFRLRGLDVQAPSGALLLRDIHWELGLGAVGVVVGPSGAGKSRLMRVLNRLDEPARGHVEVLGRPLHGWMVGELRRNVGWVPQNPALLSGTGQANLDVVVGLGLLPPHEYRARHAEVLAVAGLEPALLTRSVMQLSGGQRQRLALARALLLQPKLLLLDEPMAALDGAGAAALLKRLQTWLQRHQTSLVMVTHRIEDVRALDGRILVLVGGRVVREGHCAALLADPTGYDVGHLLTGRGGEGP